MTDRGEEKEQGVSAPQTAVGITSASGDHLRDVIDGERDQSWRPALSSLRTVGDRIDGERVEALISSKRITGFSKPQSATVTCAPCMDFENCFQLVLMLSLKSAMELRKRLKGIKNRNI